MTVGQPHFGAAGDHLVPPPDRRSGWLGLSLSGFGHLLLLFLLIDLPSAPGLDEGEGRPIHVAILAEPEAAPPVVEPVREPEPAQQPPPPKPVPVSKPEPESKPLSKRQAKPVVHSRKLQPVSAAVSFRADNVISTSAEPISTSAVAVPSDEGKTAKGQGANSDIMAQYQALLWDRIQAHKPPSARFRGKVTLRFTLSPAGELLSSEVIGSSGVAVLAEISLAALRDAAPFPPPPVDTASSQLTFTIPFIFE